MYIFKYTIALVSFNIKKISLRRQLILIGFFHFHHFPNIYKTYIYQSNSNSPFTGDLVKIQPYCMVHIKHQNSAFKNILPSVS